LVYAFDVHDLNPNHLAAKNVIRKSPARSQHCINQNTAVFLAG
jgi:hypothetical protein